MPTLGRALILLALAVALYGIAAALIGARRFRPGKAAAGSWLFGIARNRLLRSVERGRVEERARRKLRMAPLVLDDEAIERVEACREGRAVELLDGLPAEQRDAVRERVLDERGYDEIAARARTSEAVIRKRVSRGLAELRTQMEER